MRQTRESASTDSVVFCCGKTAAAALRSYRSFFSSVVGGVNPHPTPSNRTLPTADAATAQVNSAYRCSKVIRSESETTVHCCVWPCAISQRACRADRVPHALTGECNRACFVLAKRAVTLFFIAPRTTLTDKGGSHVTQEEKKAWAEALLREKYMQLGRLPTKKDFDDVACSQIKAYLGPWPRALEAAGLKKPKEKKG